MKQLIFLCILSLLTAGQISAERIIATGAPSIISEFTKVEELTKNKGITEEFRKKTLEKNLLNAVKGTLLKKFPDYQKKTEDLKDMSSIAFEQQKGTFNYYVKYVTKKTDKDKDGKESAPYIFYLFYNFAVDPEIYIQLPVDDRIYISTPELEALGNSSSSKTPAAPSTSKPADPIMEGKKANP